jgi:hypothetical protein
VRAERSALNDREVEAILDAVLADVDFPGGHGTTKDEMRRVLDWATTARINAMLLDLVLDGRVVVRWLEGNDHPRFWPGSGAQA